MNHKPLITYGGDLGVFQSIVPSLQKGIGGEAVEWKRAYGRTTKHVHLHPRFIPFDPIVEDGASLTSTSQNPEEDGILSPKDSPALTRLLDQPMLHTFWTDCSDVEVYRTTTKDAIQTWLNQVKASNIRDWLIILVEVPDKAKTKQLLPRTSVLDKIKNDFAQKQIERCISLSDPSKLDSKSAESLHTMLHRLRQLLLASYSKTLTKFEENMRAQREKRNESGWNFCHYFLLQEELAFVLEMLEVYEEALVQYDELDALFTQFVLNSHLTDTPQWLLSFQRYGYQWPALILSPSSTRILLNIREKIRNSSVSLLCFRNYLFARQASLLVKQKRVNELAQRSLAFLHNAINEISILDVMFTETGAMSAWVFVSCLEILGTVCGHGHPILHSGTLNGNGLGDHHMTPADFSVHTACLWDYARDKLYELGKQCDLLPQSKPKSDHLHKVISLAAGLVAFEEDGNFENNLSSPDEDEKKSNSASHPSEESFGSLPIEKLKNALSSKEHFQTHYLELCELAMGTYKHIGRIRSARKVGLTFANYYMDAEEYPKAIGFLVDALKTFRDDRWNLLVVETLLKLVICYKCTKDIERYLKTAAELACSKVLPIERRQLYFEEFLSSVRSLSTGKTGDIRIVSSSEDTFELKSVRVETNGKINMNGCDVNVQIEVNSLFPKPITCNGIEMAILPAEPHPTPHCQNHPINPKVSRRLSSGQNLKDGKTRVERKESLLPITCEDEDMLLGSDIIPGQTQHLRLDLGQTFETKQDKSIQGGKITCHNSHLALRRKDSQTKSESQPLKADFTNSAKSSNVQLLPGLNTVSLNAKVSESGSFRLGQLSFNLNGIDFISLRLGCRYKFNVEKVMSSIGLSEGNLNLIAGIEQYVTLELQTGSNEIKYGMVLNIRSSMALQLKSYENAPLSSEILLGLPPTNSFSQAEVRLKVKAELGPQKDNSLIEHKIILRCPWTSEETKLSLVFVPPFMSSFKVQSASRGRKFVQVLLHGLTDSSFVLSNHQLEVQGPQSKNIPLVPLNPRSQELIIKSGQTASYMFEIGVVEVPDDQPTRLGFSVMFSPSNKSHPPELYKYYFCLTQFKSQYEVKYRVDPHKGVEFCRVGTICSLVVEIRKVVTNLSELETSLMYEVRADQYMWAICGRTSGVVSMEGMESTQVTLDVMPMSPGFLPLPTVYLSKYIPADIKGNNSSVPKLDPFLPGQVYNYCKGIQMHVLPPSQSGTGLGSGTGTTSTSNSLTNDTHF